MAHVDYFVLDHHQLRGPIEVKAVAPGRGPVDEGGHVPGPALLEGQAVGLPEADAGGRGEGLQHEHWRPENILEVVLYEPAHSVRPPIEGKGATVLLDAREDREVRLQHEQAVPKLPSVLAAGAGGRAAYAASSAAALAPDLPA